MQDFHRRLAAIGLQAGGQYGLALAGGYAINMHGFIQRPSNDVDLFTTLDADLAAATKAVVDAYRSASLDVTVEHTSEHYSRLTVADLATAEASKVELVADIRMFPLVRMDVGPVLHPDDVAAGKVEALFTRAECRDFIDVDALLRSGRYTEDRLLDLAAQRDAGFDRSVFADMLLGITRFPDTEFARYEVNENDTQRIRSRMAAWRSALLGA